MDEALRVLERRAANGPEELAAYHGALCRAGLHHGIVMHVHPVGTRWRDPSAPATVLLDGAEVWPAISLGCRRCHRPLTATADVVAAAKRDGVHLGEADEARVRVHDFPACDWCAGRGRNWGLDAVIGPAREVCDRCAGSGLGATRPRWRARHGVLSVGTDPLGTPVLAMRLDGRQSGRTTRMVREAERHLADPQGPDRVIVVAPTLQHFDHIADLFSVRHLQHARQAARRAPRGRVLRFATPDRVADHTRGSPLHYAILRDHSCSVQDFDRWPDEEGIP